MPARSTHLGRRSTRRCPDCRGALLRVRRQPGDAPGAGQGRYRCLAPDCGWRGQLDRAAPAQRLARVWPAALAARIAVAARLPRLRRTALGLALAAGLCLPLAVLGVLGIGAWVGPAAAVSAGPGVSHDGRPVPAASDQRVTVADRAALPAADPDPDALALRQGCAWGQPGRSPYRGTTEQALRAAGLPPEVVREVAAQRLAGRRSGRLEIRTGAIRVLGEGRQFDPDAVALSFGLTLCLNSRVNFVAGHAEQADLYEVRDDRGRQHAVMVPDVCGNVSVLARRPERGVLAGLSRALTRRSADAAGLALALADPAGSGAADGGDPATAGAGSAGDGVAVGDGVGAGAGAPGRGFVDGGGAAQVAAAPGAEGSARAAGVLRAARGSAGERVAAATLPGAAQASGAALAGPAADASGRVGPAALHNRAAAGFERALATDPGAGPAAAGAAGEGAAVPGPAAQLIAGAAAPEPAPAPARAPALAAAAALTDLSERLAGASAVVTRLGGPVAGGSGVPGAPGALTAAGPAPVHQVPEPGGLAIAVTALVALAWALRRR